MSYTLKATVELDPGGGAYIVHSSPLENEPIDIVRKWTITGGPISQLNDGQEIMYEIGRSEWFTFCKQFGGTRYFKTEEICTVTEVPIPPPKTKLETRWKGGRWERLTKRGWVP